MGNYVKGGNQALPERFPSPRNQEEAWELTSRGAGTFQASLTPADWPHSRDFGCPLRQAPHEDASEEQVRGPLTPSSEEERHTVLGSRLSINPQKDPQKATQWPQGDSHHQRQPFHKW